MRIRSILITTAPLVIVGTVAFAYSVVSDTGVGATQASTNKAQFKTTVDVPQSIDIGGSGPVAISVQNTGTGTERVRSLAIGDLVVTPATGTCPTGSFTLGNIQRSALPSSALGPQAQFVAATATLRFNNLEDADQTGCFGAVVKVTATASSVPAQAAPAQP